MVDTGGLRLGAECLAGYAQQSVKQPRSAGGAGALRKDSQALVADLGEAAGDRDPLRLRALAAVDGDGAVPERGHVGRVPGHDAGLALSAGDDDHVDIVGHHQPVRGHKLEMQIGHYSLLSILASKARVAALNLSRHPLLQKPMTSPLYRVRLSALTGLPDQGQASLTQSSRRRSPANAYASCASFSALATASSMPPTI